MMMKPVAEGQKKILKHFDSFLKSSQLDYLKKIYAKDSAFQNAAREIASPQFRKLIVRSYDNSITFLYETGQDIKRCQPFLIAAEKQQSKVQGSLLKAMTYHIMNHKPELKKFGDIAFPKELVEDYKSFVVASSKIFLSRKLAIESAVRAVHISDEFGLEAVGYPKLSKSKDDLSVRRVHRGEVLLSEEYLSELIASVQQRTFQKSSQANSKAKKLKEWTGDQPVSYVKGILKIGSYKPKKVPDKDRSEFRRVLLELLVRDFQQEEQGTGITSAVFCSKLRDLGFKPEERALESAKNGINEEVEDAFALQHFVRMRGTAACIFKKTK